MAEIPYALAGKRIFVAGHRGMVGSAIVRRLDRETCTVLTATRELDLINQSRGGRLVCGTQARGGVSRRRKGGRHPGK
jgi:nucleoside-diphosphate-sugar epimerase